MSRPVTLRCLAAGPLVTFQDGGRPGQLRFGVPASGPMDRLAHAAANAALGNDETATGIEVSRGGLRLQCSDGSITLAVAGGGFDVATADRALEPWTVVTLRPGEELSVSSGRWGSWAYVAFAGDVVVDRWLGSASTHSIAGQGGGPVVAGLEVAVADARARPELDGEIPLPPMAQPRPTIPVVLGPQLERFADDAADTLLQSSFVLSDDYNRMGVRLLGPALRLRDALAIPSEPIVRGSVQVSGDGVPTVLLADHQTTGGYPKIATVASAALDRLVQNRPGDVIEFAAVSPGDALASTRRHHREVRDYLAVVSGPGRTLSQRLMSNNLIGWGDQDED